MEKFRIGDTVKRVESEWSGMRRGDTGLVVEITSNGLFIKEFNSKFQIERNSGAHDPDMFILFEPASLENE